MTLLKCNEIEKEGFSAVMDQKTRNLENPILEFDIPKSIGFPFLELDTGLSQFCNTMNQLLPSFICYTIRM